MSKEVGEMVRSRDVVQAEGSARTEGARRATGVRADGAAAGAGSLAPGQRWSASRKRDVVLRLLRGESLEALSREAGVEIYRRRSGGIVRSRSKRSTGRIFQNLEAVRAAVADFVERYNQTWRLEKLGYQTPIEAREEYELRQAA